MEQLEMFDRVGRVRAPVAGRVLLAKALAARKSAAPLQVAAARPVRRGFISRFAVAAKVAAVAIVVYAVASVSGLAREVHAALVQTSPVAAPQVDGAASIALAGHLFTHGCAPITATLNGREISLDAEGNFALRVKIPSRTLPAKLEFSAPGCSTAVAELDISPGTRRYTVSASILPEVALVPRGQYRNAGRAINKVRRMLPNEVRELASLIEQYCEETGLDPALVYAIVHTESHFDRHALSRANAVGLMQLVPTSGAAAALKHLKAEERAITVRQLRDPETNIRLGTAYLQMLMDRYFAKVRDPQVRLGLALAAYNWGPRNVQAAIRREGRTPRTMAELNKMLTRRAPRETRRYVKNVTERMAWYAEAV